MTKNNGSPESYIEYVEKRIRNPLEGRGSQRSIGLAQIVGTHGTPIESIVSLAREGRFCGSSSDLKGTFHLTPNLQFSGWKKTDFSDDISDILSKIEPTNPLEISTGYAESKTPMSYEKDIDTSIVLGAVVAFSGKVLDLVQQVDIDESTQEPEIVLATAPPLESVRAIYPVDALAQSALLGALGNLR